MLKYTNYDIVFQEIPDETTLAINISGCPNRCPGCHSPKLWEDIGEELTTEVIDNLIDKYSNITCVCFMGGDQHVIPPKPNLFNLAHHVWNKYPNLKVGWYSGYSELPRVRVEHIGLPFHYIKLGPYIEEFGPLNSPTTNQRLYQYSKLYSDCTIGKGWRDITYKFWKND